MYIHISLYACFYVHGETMPLASATSALIPGENPMKRHAYEKQIDLGQPMLPLLDSD